MWGSSLANAALFALLFPSVGRNYSLFLADHSIEDPLRTVHHHGHAFTTRSLRSVQPTPFKHTTRKR